MISPEREQIAVVTGKHEDPAEIWHRTGRNIEIRHHQHAADEFESTAFDQVLEKIHLLRMPPQVRLHVADLIEGKCKIRVFFEKIHRRLQIRESQLECIFSAHEYFGVEVGVWNDMNFILHYGILFTPALHQEVYAGSSLRGGCTDRFRRADV